MFVVRYRLKMNIKRIPETAIAYTVRSLMGRIAFGCVGVFFYHV